QPRGDSLALGHPRLVDVLEDDHLRAIERGFRLAAGEAGLPRQCGVTAGVDEAGRLDLDLAITRRQMQPLDAPALDIDIAQHGADDRGDAGLAYGAFDPAAKRDLVVIDDRGQRTVAVIELLRILPERFHDVISDAVGELVAV